MSESALSALASLRQEGANGLDPCRFHYLEALAQRMQAQPPAVQQVLEGKLQAAVADYRERVAQSRLTPDQVRPLSSPVQATPLGALNCYIQSRSQPGADRSTTSAGVPQEMQSVRRFSEAWSKMAAHKQVDHAFERAPVNAGPLNSHTLVLRSLVLMRDLSPEYLRRFLSQVDSWLWLEQLNQGHTLKEAKPERRGRLKK